MKRFIPLALIIACLATPGMQAQVSPTKPDTELTQDEAEIRIQTLRDAVVELEAKLKEKDGELENWKAELDKINKEIKDCYSALYALLDATEADVDRFRERFGKLRGKVRDMQKLSNDQLADRRAEVRALEDELNEMRMIKIAVLPEFYDNIIALAKDIRGLYREKRTNTYTVGTWAKDRECLWNISAKRDIYGDAHQWPKIWLANTDQIRNPDIIHPGQVLQIPPAAAKTSEEAKAERRYYREKREKMQQAQETPQGDAGSGTN